MISCRIINSYGVADLDQKSLLYMSNVSCQEELIGERDKQPCRKEVVS